ncbi:MAG TPA: hypothetical protein VD998_04320 [Verrucomicrobiae bacterium]|nr:hypothetical protein [Verrucomicrobiae bacterium]
MPIRRSGGRLRSFSGIRYERQSLTGIAVDRSLAEVRRGRYIPEKPRITTPPTIRLKKKAAG